MNNIFRRQRNNAFSLVELSIVLVILGLLVGGILAGRSMIHAAELRSVSTDLQRYQSSVMAFRDKYFYYPGDMPNATQFWGAADPVTATCTGMDVSSLGTATCNGNGDGRIAYTNNGCPTCNSELYHSWVHLKNAGLVEGNYTGVVSAGATAVAGTNIPRGKFPGIGYTLLSFRETGAVYFWNGDYNPAIVFGKDYANSNITNGMIFLPEDLYNIDAKIDDGKPGTGKIRDLYPNGANSCHTLAGTANQVATDYYLTGTAANCMGIYSLNSPGM